MKDTGNTAGCYHNRIIEWWDEWLREMIKFCLDCNCCISVEKQEGE